MSQKRNHSVELQSHRQRDWFATLWWPPVTGEKRALPDQVVLDGAAWNLSQSSLWCCTRNLILIALVGRRPLRLAVVCMEGANLSANTCWAVFKFQPPNGTSLLYFHFWVEFGDALPCEYWPSSALLTHISILAVKVRWSNILWWKAELKRLYVEDFFVCIGTKRGNE